jgi:hypothetical protein
MSTKKVKGLRLTLGGAPDSPFQIPGLPGYYMPSRVTPIGGPGEATEEQAEQFAALPEAITDLKGAALDEALKAQGLSLEGTAPEKRLRYAVAIGQEPVVVIEEISEAQAEREREFQAELIENGRRGALNLRGSAQGAEIAQVQNELAAAGQEA